jgi:NAD(P)-dependent dehydrogenase (short-subunit alcohol dehydrogenase family)
VKPVLENTVALVTGASSGIGAATASALTAQGAAVALAARRRDRLEELAAGIRGQGGTALTLECDVTDQEQATAAVERTATVLGRLDTLVNNAGVMLLGPAAGAPLAEWQQMVELNVLGLLYCAHAALPHLLRAAADGPRLASSVAVAPRLDQGHPYVLPGQLLAQRLTERAHAELGRLGAAMVAGYLAERLVRRRLLPSGWDAAEIPVVTAGNELCGVMAMLGLRSAGAQAKAS